MKGFFITRLAGGNPSWWSGMTPEDWAQMGSTTMAVSADREWCVCMVVGTAAQVAKVAALADTLQITGDKATLDEKLLAADVTKASTFLSTKALSVTVNDKMTKRDVMKKVAEYFDKNFPGCTDACLPGMAGDPDEKDVEIKPPVVGDVQDVITK